MRFPEVLRDGSGGFQYANSGPRLSVRFVMSKFHYLRSWGACTHDYGYHDLINWASFDCSSAYDLLQRSKEVNWTPCNTDGHLFYYTFDLGSVHDVPTVEVKTCKLDSQGIVFTGQEFPWYYVSWLVLAELRVTFY